MATFCVQLEREAAELGLRLKLALLQETLADIVSFRLRDTLAHLASFFDGDLPGFKQVCWIMTNVHVVSRSPARLSIPNEAHIKRVPV